MTGSRKSGRVCLLSGLLIWSLFGLRLFGGEEQRKFVKIRVPTTAQALQAAGVAPDVWVKEANYLVTKVTPEELAELRAQGFVVEDITENDFVQRLVKVYVQDPLQRRMVLEIGKLDVWETQPDFIIARAFDKQISTLRKVGLRVDVLYENALQLVTAFAPVISADAGLYHTYAELDSELHALAGAHPARTRVSSIGESGAGRKLWAIKISDNVSTEEDEPQILFLGCHHAREWISVEVPLLLANYLVSEYETNPAIKELVDSLQIWIIPMTNPDGHQYSVLQNRLWRKNRRDNADGTFGVDLNRNYGYEWGGPGSSGDTVSEIYRGPSPFSEPESKAVRDFVNAHSFRAIITYHSYSQLVLYPWGHTDGPAPDSPQMNQTATSMADSIYSVHGKTYVPQQTSDLYLASGDTTDWSYGDHQIPSFTIELRPKSYSGGGFVLPEDQIQPTWEENRAAILNLLSRFQGKARRARLYHSAWHVKTRYADETVIHLANASGQTCYPHVDLYSETGVKVGELDIQIGPGASVVKLVSSATQASGSGMATITVPNASECSIGTVVEYVKAGRGVTGVVIFLNR